MNTAAKEFPSEIIWSFGISLIFRIFNPEQCTCLDIQYSLYISLEGVNVYTHVWVFDVRHYAWPNYFISCLFILVFHNLVHSQKSLCLYLVPILVVTLSEWIFLFLGHLKCNSLWWSIGFLLFSCRCNEWLRANCKQFVFMVHNSQIVHHLKGTLVVVYWL